MKNPRIPLAAACLVALAAAAQSPGPTEPAPQPTDPGGAAHGAIVDKTPEGMKRAKPDAGAKARPGVRPDTERRDSRRSPQRRRGEAPAHDPHGHPQGHPDKGVVDGERRNGIR